MAPINMKLVRKSPRMNSEHVEQSFLFQWAALNEAKHPELALLFAIPNFAGRLGKATALHGAKLKAEGRKKGVPDICLPVARGGYHALYIEMKVGPNKTSADQDRWLDALAAHRNSARVAWGWEQARDMILAYLALADR